MPDPRDRDRSDAPRVDPAAAQASRTAPSPPGVSADAPRQPAGAQRDINLGGQDQPEVSNVTVPGGKYLMPDGKTFVNAQGEPIDESGKRLDQSGK